MLPFNLKFSLKVTHSLKIAKLEGSFCHSLAFVQIGPSAIQLWRHIHFSKWWPRRLNSTSVLVFVTLLIREGRNIPAYQISVRYLNTRLRYYYFRFLKTNVRRVGILLPVSISTFASPSAFILHLPTKFRPNQTIRDRVMTSHPVSKMVAIGS